MVWNNKKNRRCSSSFISRVYSNGISVRRYCNPDKALIAFLNPKWGYFYYGADKRERKRVLALVVVSKMAFIFRKRIENVIAFRFTRLRRMSGTMQDPIRFIMATSKIQTKDLYCLHQTLLRDKKWRKKPRIIKYPDIR